MSANGIFQRQGVQKHYGKEQPGAFEVLWFCITMVQDEAKK
jgi:hypothetical protein